MHIKILKRSFSSKRFNFNKNEIMYTVAEFQSCHFIGHADYHLIFVLMKTGLDLYHGLHLYFTNKNNIGNTGNTKNVKWHPVLSVKKRLHLN